MQISRKGLIALSILIALVSGLGWMVYVPIRQERINRALIAAIKQNDTKTALALLEEGANPNACDASPGHVPIWRLLLDRLWGKRPAPPSPLTALMVTVAPYQDKNGWEYPPNRPQIVKALLEKGANPNVSLGYGFTPLFWSVAAGVYAGDGRRDDTIKLLLEHGADANPPSVMSPLLFAVMDTSPSDDVIISLLHRGANIDAQDPAGQTPLMMAVRSRKVHVVQLLLSYHANPNKAMRTTTPLSFARRYAAIPEEKQITTLLNQAGAKER